MSLAARLTRAKDPPRVLGHLLGIGILAARKDEGDSKPVRADGGGMPH